SFSRWEAAMNAGFDRGIGSRQRAVADAIGFGGKPAAPPAKILPWFASPNAAGTMLGFVDARLPSGMVIHDMKLLKGSNGKLFIPPPSVKQTNKDGSPRLDAKGKQQWTPMVSFADRAASDRFRDLILAALERDHPEALAEEAL